MKALIVYYSRTGITAAAAKLLAEMLAPGGQVDVEEIREVTSRDGAMGWLKAGHDATLKKCTPIEPSSRSAADYDIVIVGTPIWAWTMASGVRSWLSEHVSELKQVAFFCTMGGSGDKRAFAHMAEICGKAPLAVMTLIDKDVRADAHRPKVQQFAESILGAMRG
jgi:menaquinone-dependent protoporphyrinogen IX oxidase